MVAGSSDNELVSVREAAKECGKNAETVRRWIWSGKLPAQKLGNQLFIKKRELIGFCGEIATQRYKAGPKPDFLERAIALQNRIKNRGAEPTNAAELIRKVRQERMNELKQSLH